jgi:serine/threonine-protein kinase
MSEVRRGEDTVLRRSVAIKILRGDGDPASIARFEREAQVLARLQHPNVVTVFDVGADDDERFIVMELVDGPTLRDILNERGRLDARRAATIAAAIADALAYAHGRDIVHRDVKPSNVLLGTGDHVKLADLGIAKLLTTDTSAATSGVIGTARYSSPEQARGEPVDGRSDLYSLGCVLFEMLVGRPPFEGDAAALAYAHVHRQAPRARSEEPTVPEHLDALVAAMLEKEPSARPQTAEAVRAGLLGDEPEMEPATGGPTEQATTPLPTVRTEPLPTPTPTRRLRHDGPMPSRRWIWIAAAAALFAFALLALIPLLARDTLGERRAAGRTASPPAASPPEADAPAEPETPGAAAQDVIDVVNEGVSAGEVSGDIVGEVQSKVDEIVREVDEEEGVEKAFEKISELQDKVAEALEEGEITSQARADAINDALEGLAAAVGSA